MELNEQLIQAITKAVVEQLQGNQPQPHNSEGETLAGKTRMRPMHSYEGAEKAPQGNRPEGNCDRGGSCFSDGNPRYHLRNSS